MLEQPHSDLQSRIEELRAQHKEPRALVDALQHEAEVRSAVHARDLGPMVEEALRISREIGYEDGESIGLLQVGFIHYLWQRNQQAFAMILEAMPRLEAMGKNRLQALGSAALAGLNNTIGNYQRAIEYAHDALVLLENEVITEWNGWPEYMMGDAYRNVEDFDKAREHYHNAFEVFEFCGHEGGMARAQIGLSAVCRTVGDYEQAEAHLDMATELAKKRNDPIAMARLLLDRGLIREMVGDMDQALALIEESLALRRDVGAGLIIATCLIELGKLLVAIDRPDKAVERLTEAIQLATEHDHKPRTYKAHKALADAYAKKKDFEQALEHRKEYQRIKEEVLATDAATRMHNLEISLEASAAQKEAELVRKHVEELTQKNDELARLLNELQDAQEMLIQSEKMASLGQLTAGIAHEIKNPLNFVNNFSVMTTDLADELTDEIRVNRSEAVEAVESSFLQLVSEIRANAQRILEHGRRAGQVVNSMLVHTRHSGGKKTRVDVNELVEACIELAYHGFSGNNAGYDPVIEKQFADDVGVFVVIEDQVARVLTNILNNAFYATHDRSKSEQVDYRPLIIVQTTINEACVSIRVADNGPGIPDEQKSKVFEPFFTTKPTGTGTGLGLSQSYDIITKRHGGSLTVEDTVGGGATFVITIASR